MRRWPCCCTCIVPQRLKRLNAFERGRLCDGLRRPCGGPLIGRVGVRGDLVERYRGPHIGDVCRVVDARHGVGGVGAIVGDVLDLLDVASNPDVGEAPGQLEKFNLGRLGRVLNTFLNHAFSLLSSRGGELGPCGG